MDASPANGRFRIVVGLDDSEGAREALAFAAAHFPEAELLVVTADDRTEVAQQLLHHAEGSTGLPIQTYQRAGDASDVVLKLAQETKADLIVLGRSSTPLERALLGSVAASVAKKADRPVLIVRQKPLAEPLKLLVTTDGSELAMRAVRFVGRHLAHWRPQVRVLVVEAPEVPHPMRALEEASGHLAAQGLQTVGEHRYGEPAAEILQAIEEDRPDLLVIGSRGLSGMSKLFLGSVSDAVIRQAACSVLVVHEGNL